MAVSFFYRHRTAGGTGLFFFLFCIIFTLTSIFTQCPVRFGKDHDLNIIKKDLLNLTEFIFDLDFFLNILLV